MTTKTTKKTNNEIIISVDGSMTFGQDNEGLKIADFACAENVMMEPFRGRCFVQMMRDGNVYINALPKKKRNKPLFREDNSSLSKGRDGRYYFYFSLEEEQLNQLPVELVRQARAIALKVANELNKLYERD